MKESRQDGVRKRLAPFRQRIDDIDDEIMTLLRTRFGIVRKVARIKAKDSIRIVQTDRVREVKERNARTAKKYGISPTLIRTIYALIIDEAHNIEHKIGRQYAASSKKPRGKSGNHA